MYNLEETKDFFKNYCLQRCNHNSNESCICKVAICFKEIEKAEEQNKILEILFKKSVDIRWLNAKHSVEEYNRWTYFNTRFDNLTEEEFKLLKRYSNKIIVDYIA